jgi:hypothetical protein
LASWQSLQLQNEQFEKRAYQAKMRTGRVGFAQQEADPKVKAAKSQNEQ